MDKHLNGILSRIADNLDRLTAHLAPKADNAKDTTTWIWHRNRLGELAQRDALPLDLFQGIDDQRQQLLANSRHFAQGLPAHDVLLWGARGMGKSSLIHAVVAAVNMELKDRRPALNLISIDGKDIPNLGTILGQIDALKHPGIIFCDDLSFVPDQGDYHLLKNFLEGTLVERRHLFYATSNHRHLIASPADENASSLHQNDTLDDRISLSDRFGLWLGFHRCSFDQWRSMVKAHLDYRGLKINENILKQADRWARQRSGLSGRAAAQFARHHQTAITPSDCS